MKQIKIKALYSFLIVLGLSSCLKEARMNIDTGNGNTANVIEFANTGDNVASATSKYPRFNTDLGSIGSGESVDFNINVSYSGANTAPQDITVNLEIDPSVLTLFNTQNGSNYVVPPSDIYKFPSSVIIKKGTRMTQVKATITNNSSFDFAVSYALPLKITSANTGIISGNFGAAMYSFGLRNIYDGVYEVKGYAFRADPASPLQGPVGPIERGLATSGATSVTWQGTVPWANGGGSNLPGGYEPIITLDAATNKVSLSSSAATITANPTYNNHYDPATKTFYIQFYWGAGPSARLHTDTLVYLRAR